MINTKPMHKRLEDLETQNAQLINLINSMSSTMITLNDKIELYKPTPPPKTEDEIRQEIMNNITNTFSMDFESLRGKLISDFKAQMISQINSNIIDAEVIEPEGEQNE